MSFVPILIICGEKNSGKSEVAQAVLRARPGSVALAIADRFKRFAQEVFDFSDDVTWGPSHLRDEPDPRYGIMDEWWEARHRFFSKYTSFLRDLRMGSQAASLEQWFYALAAQHLDSQREHGSGRLIMHPDEKPFVTKVLTPRTVFQTLGSEWGRSVDPDIWIRAAMSDAAKLLGGGHSYDTKEGLKVDAAAPPAQWVVISDGRIPHEPLAVKMAGGAAVLVESHPVIGGPIRWDAPVEVEAKHSSERLDLIPTNRYDGIFVNRKQDGLPSLEGTAREMMDALEVRHGRWSTFNHAF